MTEQISNTITHYNAHAFNDSLNKGRCSGVLALSRGGFKFIVDNQVKIHFPLIDTQLTLGGASDRLIFVSHPRYSDWSFYTSDRSLLLHPDLNNIEALAAQIKPMRNKRMRNRGLLMVCVLLLLLVPVLVITNADTISRLAARQIPVAWEAQLGESVYAQYQLQHDILQDDKVSATVKQLTTYLTNELKGRSYDFQFYIVNASSLNAFALPGGIIVIHSGLILRADSANELLGVLAHELAHVTEQHGIRSLVNSAGILVIIQALLGDSSGLMAVIATAAPFLLNLQYSRSFEAQADAKAVGLLKSARINPHGLVQFFEKLITEQEKMSNKGTAELFDSVSGFLSTHPATQERIDHIKVLATDNTQSYHNINNEFYQLKTRVQAFAAGNIGTMQ